MSTNTLVWNVYIENFNSKNIEIFNIFNHYYFRKDLIDVYNEKDKDVFLEKVKKRLMYYYWSKCEWEIILSDWPPSDRFNDKKVSVYDQIMLNWDIFSDYIWDNKDLIINFKEL